MTFFGWFVHYALVFAVLAVVAGLGVFVGKKLLVKWRNSYFQLLQTGA